MVGDERLELGRLVEVAGRDPGLDVLELQGKGVRSTSMTSSWIDLPMQQDRGSTSCARRSISHSV